MRQADVIAERRQGARASTFIRYRKFLANPQREV
jgi:hypothetical protein